MYLETCENTACRYLQYRFEIDLEEGLFNVQTDLKVFFSSNITWQINSLRAITNLRTML